MIRDLLNGFCMALADSVPGVSGGTVAFIMGFYDRFISAIDSLVFGTRKEKISSLRYLFRLGIGWVIGMGMAVLALNALLVNHIYAISSLFLGFIICSIPLIMREEKESLHQSGNAWIFGIAGLILVVGISMMSNGSGASIRLDELSLSTAIRLFLTGLAAIAAMFLPGISGSTMLLVFGVYVPVMVALRAVMGLQLSYVPGLIVFMLGILTGAASVVRLIKVGLQKYRPAMIWFILGMMIGSVYAIVIGPTTLQVPQLAMSFTTFRPLWAFAGFVLVLLLEYSKEIALPKAGV